MITNGSSKASMGVKDDISGLLPDFFVIWSLCFDVRNDQSFSKQIQDDQKMKA